MAKIFVAIILFFSVYILPVYSDDYNTFWNWTPAANYHKAVVQVTSLNINKQPWGAGTGVVIYKSNKPVRVNGKIVGYFGYVLTAAHIFADVNNTNIIVQAKKALIEFEGVENPSSGTVRGMKLTPLEYVTEFNDKDVAIISCTIPVEIPALKIASTPVQPGDIVEFCGYGYGLQLRHFANKVHKVSNNVVIEADEFFISGDSGGAVLNDNHEVVGIISGARKYYQKFKLKMDNKDITVTWPARCSGLKVIMEVIQENNIPIN